jgi:retron-type reverse transcriptase
LDIRKAFDTISHDYLLKAYKFFNFGDNIIRWLQVIGTNRRACVILENGLFTKFFYLERGTAQGDTISPYIFNIGYQILLFKLNFDLQIEGILEPPAVPPDITPPNHQTPQETVSIMNRKAYAFADDANVLSSLNRNSLARIKKILENFGTISGLECNVEKTTVLCINSAVPDFVREVGFTAVDSVTILGLEIEGDTGKFDNSFEKICLKYKKILRFGNILI